MSTCHTSQMNEESAIMHGNRNLSSERKSNDEEVWQDDLAQFKKRRLPILTTKLESSFSFQKKSNNAQELGDGKSESRLYKPQLKTPSFILPRKSNDATIAKQRKIPRDDVSLHAPNENSPPNPQDSTGKFGRENAFQVPSQQRSKQQRSTSRRDMAMLKRLNRERERVTKGSLEAAQRVIRHGPRKLRQKIQRRELGHGVSLADHKLPSISRNSLHDGQQPEAAAELSKTDSQWKGFYVGSVAIPQQSIAAASELISSDSNHSSTTAETVGSLSKLMALKKLQCTTGTPDTRRASNSGAKFLEKQQRPIRKDMPSLLEKPFSFSPVGLRNYEGGRSSSPQNQSASFLEHLRFIADGKASPTGSTQSDCAFTPSSAATLRTDLKRKSSDSHQRMGTGNKRAHIDSSKSRNRLQSSTRNSSTNSVVVQKEVPITKDNSPVSSRAKLDPKPNREPVRNPEEKLSIINLFRQKIVAPFRGGDRIVLAIVFVALFAQIGIRGKIFFEVRRSSVPTTTGQSPGKSFPKLTDGSFYSKPSPILREETRGRKAVTAKPVQWKLKNSVVKPITTATTGLHQNNVLWSVNETSETPSKLCHDDLVSSPTTPFVASRRRRTGNNNNKSLPNHLPIRRRHHRHPKGGNSIIKKFVRSMTLPVVFLFRSGRKLFLSVARLGDISANNK